MKGLALIILLLASGAFAQETIPAGTILPAQLNSSLRSNRLQPGQTIQARVMQDVPLPGRSTIRAGAKVIGHIIAVTPASNVAGAQISLRFDTLAVGKRRILLVTNLRALATMMDVSEAQVPRVDPIVELRNIAGPPTRSEARSPITDVARSLTAPTWSDIRTLVVRWFRSVRDPARSAAAQSMVTTSPRLCGCSLPMLAAFTIFPT